MSNINELASALRALVATGTADDPDLQMIRSAIKIRALFKAFEAHENKALDYAAVLIHKQEQPTVTWTTIMSTADALEVNTRVSNALALALTRNQFPVAETEAEVTKLPNFVTSVKNTKFCFSGKTIQHAGRTLRQIKSLVAIPGIIGCNQLGGWIENEANLSREGTCWVHMRSMVYDEARVKGSALVTEQSTLFGTILIDGNVTVSGNKYLSSGAFTDAASYNAEHTAEDRNYLLMMQGTSITVIGGVEYWPIRALRDIPEHGVKAGDLGGWLANNSGLAQDTSCWVARGAYVGPGCRVEGHALVYGGARLVGHAVVKGGAEVGGTAMIKDNSVVDQKAKVGGTAMIVGDSFIGGYAHIMEGTHANAVPYPLPLPAKEEAKPVVDIYGPEFNDAEPEDDGEDDDDEEEAPAARRPKVKHPKYTILKRSQMLAAGSEVYQIKALRDIEVLAGRMVKAGDLGGFVQSEENLSHGGKCWISDVASVSGAARVVDNAQVRGNATVCGSAFISESAVVEGTALVLGEAVVTGEATVSGKAMIEDKALISGSASICGNSKVRGNARVTGEVTLQGNSNVGGDVDIEGNLTLNNFAREDNASVSEDDDGEVEIKVPSAKSSPKLPEKGVPKYEFTDEKIRQIHKGGKPVTLRRIRACRDISFPGRNTILAGALGGFIRSAENLSMFGACWVDYGARVFEKAHVSENALVTNVAVVFGEATISGKSSVAGEARVHGKAQVRDGAWVGGKAEVMGDAMICDSAQVTDKSVIAMNAKIDGRATVTGKSKIAGEVHVTGTALLVDYLRKDSAVINACAGTGELTVLIPARAKTPKLPRALALRKVRGDEKRDEEEEF